MTAPGIDLDALLRRLHLPTVRRLYPDLTQRAEQEGLAYREFLALLIAEEVAHRAQTRIQRCVRRARFTPATALIDELSTATRKGRLRHVLPAYTHPHVLVIDEVGYLTYGPDAANVLFHVVNERYLHHRPMLFTTNKPLSAWGRVLHDADLAEAILDRVLERGRHLELRGRSYRTRHAPLDLTPASEPPSPGPARISGNHRPEFSEPTQLHRPAGHRIRCSSAGAAGCHYRLPRGHDPVSACEDCGVRA